MSQTKLPTEEYDPDEVADQAAGAKMTNFDLVPKWPQYKFSNLEALHPEGYANDGNAPNQTGDKPQDCPNNTAKYQPNNITNDTHCIPPLSRLNSVSLAAPRKSIY